MNFLLSRQNTSQVFRKLVLDVVPCSGILARNSILCSNSGNKTDSYLSYCKLPHNSFSTSRVNHNKSLLIQRIKQELLVFKKVDFDQLKHVPYPAKLYGFGGLIPFVFPPMYFIIGSYSPFLATAQLMYGVTILAFIGGVKWGNALAKDDISHEQIGISTVPSLVAWVSLLVPEPLGFLVVTSGLIGALYIDLISSKYPPWFCTLRSSLTGIASLSLFTTFLFCLFH